MLWQHADDQHTKCRVTNVAVRTVRTTTSLGPTGKKNAWQEPREDREIKSQRRPEAIDRAKRSFGTDLVASGPDRTSRTRYVRTAWSRPEPVQPRADLQSAPHRGHGIWGDRAKRSIGPDSSGNGPAMASHTSDSPGRLVPPQRVPSSADRRSAPHASRASAGALATTPILSVHRTVTKRRGYGTGQDRAKHSLAADPSEIDTDLLTYVFNRDGFYERLAGRLLDNLPWWRQSAVVATIATVARSLVVHMSQQAGTWRGSRHLRHADPGARP